MEFVRSYDSVSFGLPSIVGGSAPASPFSGPAQRLLVLRPACSPGRLCDPLHQRLQQSRCLHCCSDCYRVERTSSRAGLPPLWTGAFHGARSEEHTSELQSRVDLVCRLLLEKKKKTNYHSGISKNGYLLGLHVTAGMGGVFLGVLT